MDILLVGLSHKTAPVEILEKFAFSATSTRDVLQRLTGEFKSQFHEAAILNTCNRVELYVSTPNAEAAAPVLQQFLVSYHRQNAPEVAPHLYAKWGHAASRHLFEVASGIASLVVGEPQVLGQVKEAQDVAQATGTLGPMLHGLFEHAVRAGKRARTETAISEGSLSISSVAVDLAVEVLHDLHEKRVIIIGASTMGELTARSLMERGARSVIVANRTFTRAFEIAEQWGIEAVPFEALETVLADADIVITSTGAPHPILYAGFIGKVMARRPDKPLILIDIAVPRDVEVSVAHVPGVHLYDMDDLRQVADSNLCKRAIEIENVQHIIDEEVGKFNKWLNALDSVPTIVLLRGQAENVRQQELERTYEKWKDLTPAQREAIEEITRRLMNRWLKGPVEFLRERAKEGNGVGYVEALRELFELDRLEPSPEEPASE